MDSHTPEVEGLIALDPSVLVQITWLKRHQLRG